MKQFMFLLLSACPADPQLVTRPIPSAPKLQNIAAKACVRELKKQLNEGTLTEEYRCLNQTIRAAEEALANAIWTGEKGLTRDQIKTLNQFAGHLFWSTKHRRRMFGSMPVGLYRCVI